MTREEIIRNLEYTMEKHKNDIVDTFDTNISVMCKDILEYLEQEPKTGHWMIVYCKSIYAHLVCDKCLSNAPYDCRTNYCPNCGVKMVEPQERSEK